MGKKAATNGSTYSAIMTNIRKGIFAPIYLLQGEERWFADSIANSIRKLAIAEEDCDFNLSTYYGADVDFDSVIAMSRSYPIMAPRRVVMLREMQTMRDAKRMLEKLETCALKAMPTTIMVITYNAESLGVSHPLVKAINKVGGIILTSRRVPEWQLTNYISEYCKEKQLFISRDASEMLTEFIGSDLSRLFSTIDKLSAALPINKKNITAEIVEQLTGYSKDFNNNELVNALSERNYAKCMQIVDYFKHNPSKNPTTMTVAFIFNFFSQLTICYWSKDKSISSLRTIIEKASESRLKLLSSAIPKYNAHTCINIIHHIRWFDAASKGIDSSQNEHDLLHQLIFKIFTS